MTSFRVSMLLALSLFLPTLAWAQDVSREAPASPIATASRADRCALVLNILSL
ncbi:hypothetical protein GCM10009552_35850 [Rothia nasimurium]|uniref:Uncharacterized protein n=1 Tax=Luteibacter anthropi TaxID=564369 RepID=A0A7X5ZJZ2_9GAMM|nr:hypothetical protein [Luteibacter anthropi]NII08538.1 hypothetical protein [Luteibacter anthropi]